MAIQHVYRGALSLALVAFLAADADASFQLSFSNLSTSTTAMDGTSLDFSLPATQSSADNFPTSINVLNIGEPTASGTAPLATYTVTEMITITGSSGTETGTLTSNFSITGKLASFVGFSFVPTSGAGDYSFSGPTFAQPGIGSSAVNNSTSTGNLSLVVTPSVVPEPASLAMLGLGLAGAGLVARRRRAK